MRRLLHLVPALLLLALPLGAEKNLTPQSRAFLIRGLTAEYATLKKALPRGLDGLHIKTSGEIDERALGIQLANNGPAVRPGELVQVTRLVFKNETVVFEINGGGKKKRKWYQRIEVGMGGRTTPVNQQQVEVPTGSSITLNFGGPLPDLTVEQVKQYLAPVLDFSQRSASLVLTEAWPPEIQEAVKNHEIKGGMTRDMVLASRGKPERKIREKKGQVEQETWVYGNIPSKILLVVFENDEVVEARQFTPGVAATKVPRMDDPPEAAPATTNPPPSQPPPNPPPKPPQ